MYTHNVKLLNSSVALLTTFSIKLFGDGCFNNGATYNTSSSSIRGSRSNY